MTGIRLAAGGVALIAGLALTGCTASEQRLFRDPAVPAGSFSLVSFTSCDDALARLKEAAKEAVGPYGFGGWAGGGRAIDMAGGAPAPEAAAADGAMGQKTAPGQSTPSYSGTNTHEAGVDEPDLVKTDGRRIVTVIRGVLRVVDPASKELVGELKLRGDGPNDSAYWGDANLLLAGDHALILVNGYGYGYYRGPAIDAAPGKMPAFSGPRLMLVDLTGPPRLLSTYTVDGQLVDARQVGNTVRVVTKSSPRLEFPYAEGLTDPQRETANRRIIDKSTVDDWLPRYTRVDGGQTDTGRVNCEAVSRPAAYSATSLLTLLTFDLARPSLGSGDPLTVVADGDTVYSNGPSLYVATDQRWRAIAVRASDGSKQFVADEKTELYKFDTTGPGRPKYVASGVVPGYLVNQYAMSEWDGHLRVATTIGQVFGQPGAKSSSGVYVLAQKGANLSEVGKVTGLGKGERIYSVRFTGPIGYVVTFRQVDPLYTVDLTKPTQPRVTGELKITGYSAYLHPIGAGRLLGIGQEASTEGRRLGTQVSLFDVSDLENPRRLAQYHVRYGQSEAEFDPHAFLFWPETGLLVVPMSVYQGSGAVGVAAALRVTGATISEIGSVSQPNARVDGASYPSQIRRALVVGDSLWTVSDAGLQANDLNTVSTTAWIPVP